MEVWNCTLELNMTMWKTMRPTSQVFFLVFQHIFAHIAQYT